MMLELTLGFLSKRFSLGRTGQKASSSGSYHNEMQRIVIFMFACHECLANGIVSCCSINRSCIMIGCCGKQDVSAV